MGFFSKSGSAVVGGIGDVFGGVINNLFAKWREDQAREQNYQYNEMAADNADARTRALYKDLQSPAALLQQYQDAGLSPSLMFGGSGAGGSVPQGAQGEGSSGIAPQTYGINPVQAAQLQLMQAQANKANAEADNLRGEGKMGEAIFGKLVEETNLILAQKGLTKTTERLKSAEADLAEVKAFITESTETEQIEEIKAKAYQARSDADRAFEEYCISVNNHKISDETRDTTIKQLKQQYENLVADYALKLTEAQRNQFEIAKDKFYMVLDKIKFEKDIDFRAFQVQLQTAIAEHMFNTDWAKMNMERWQTKNAEINMYLQTACKVLQIGVDAASVAKGGLTGSNGGGKFTVSSGGL